MVKIQQCAWWLSVADGRDPRRFEDVVGDFHGVWDRTGFMNVRALRNQIHGQRSRYRMVTEQVGPGKLDGLFGRWPLLVGFKHPGGFGHPPPDSLNGNEGDFGFTGYIAYRKPGYYHSPMKSGTIVVGYPEEYVTRMP